MGPLRVIIVLAAIFAVALGAGRIWNLKPAHGETDPTRTGQVVLLNSPTGNPVWLALERSATYDLQKAMVQNDQAALKEASRIRSAFPVPSGTRVRVVSLNTSKREVEVLDGTHAGIRGWVEHDLLKPERPSRKPIQPNPRRRY